MTLERVLPFTKSLLQQAVNNGDTVIDGTAGNGHDTLFLAECVGETGRVYSFDIQEAAITSTQAKLDEANLKQVNLINDGHQRVLNYVQTEVSAAIFNLGYLPGSDLKTTTHGNTTWKAVIDILTILKTNGLIILVIYHGHESGKLERDYLESCMAQLDPKKILS